MEEYVSQLLKTTGPEYKSDIQLMVDPDAPSKLSTHLTLKTGKRIMGGVDIDMYFSI
jgi:hypothetical protein